MKIERDRAGPGPIVTGFGVGVGGFRVGEERHRALLLTVAGASAWSPPALADLALADVQPLLDAKPEFILLGTGPTLRRPPISFVRALDAAGIGVEAMDSRAAARAWGVLRGEGRLIGAALYPLD